MENRNKTIERLSKELAEERFLRVLKEAKEEGKNIEEAIKIYRRKNEEVILFPVKYTEKICVRLGRLGANFFGVFNWKQYKTL